jgi:3-hydroxybutyryl-CoA dehydrogenase/3-hydroxyacyl-CoA dehydrogenase
LSSSTAPDAVAGSGADAAIRRVAVIGAGVMGAGIAQVLALAGREVVLRDLDPGVLDRARAGIRQGPFGLDAAVRRGRIDDETSAAAAGRISYVTELEAAADVDLVVEAVPENLALKVEVFRALDRIVRPGGILASNSSGFPIAALAAATDRPQFVVGWHWASPAPAMRLAEIVRTPQTAESTIAAVCALATAAGKNPVVIADAPMSWGYVANRVYAAAYREAARVVDEGIATPEQVDQLLIDCFRWPVGPFGMSRGAGSGWQS